MNRPRYMIKRPDIFWKHDWTKTKVVAWKEKLIHPKALTVYFDIMAGRVIVIYDRGRMVSR